MKLAITLVHSKTPEENEAQAQALLSLVERIEQTHPELDPLSGEPILDELGQPLTYVTFYYRLKDLDLEHAIHVYQVVPFGVARPPSSNLVQAIPGRLVEYGQGDEDKTGEHPRFFNWGIKRGTDDGADVSLYLTTPAGLNLQRLKGHLTAIERRPDNVDFIEDSFGKIGTLRLLKRIGQLKEDRSFSEAITDYKSRISGGGLRTG